MVLKLERAFNNLGWIIHKISEILDCQSTEARRDRRPIRQGRSDIIVRRTLADGRCFGPGDDAPFFRKLGNQLVHDLVYLAPLLGIIQELAHVSAGGSEMDVRLDLK